MKIAQGIVIVAALGAWVLAVSMIVGCDGVGGAGGQGLHFAIHQNAPPGSVAPNPEVVNLNDLPRLATADKGGAGNVSIIYVRIVDGGFGFPNPSPALAADPAPEATTQPAK